MRNKPVADGIRMASSHPSMSNHVGRAASCLEDRRKNFINEIFGRYLSSFALNGLLKSKAAATKIQGTFYVR